MCLLLMNTKSSTFWNTFWRWMPTTAQEVPGLPSVMLRRSGSLAAILMCMLYLNPRQGSIWCTHIQWWNWMTITWSTPCKPWGWWCHALCCSCQWCTACVDAMRGHQQGFGIQVKGVYLGSRGHWILHKEHDVTWMEIFWDTPHSSPSVVQWYGQT